jgi:hypothetical protein
MDYLSLKITKKILEKVLSKDGLLTWYNIVKSIDQLNDIEKDIPPFYILEELVRIGFLELNPSDSGNFPKYKLTNTGRNFLGSYNSLD